MGGGRGHGLPACFRRFPGVVLQLSAEGIVVESNGLLERELGRELLGRSFVEVLDPGSSQRKWSRLLALASEGADEADVVWELILSGRDTLPEPRPFSVLWDADARRFWLLEHRPDPRLDRLHDQVVGVNSELANTQRQLLKERGRLANALEELEEQYRRGELLSRTVQEQNEELERSNRALDEFAHVVSHDLKAPLRSIASYATWLEEDLADTLQEESRLHLDRLRSRVGRMQAMIQGVLEYARAGRRRSQPELVDVGELVDGVIELLDPPDAVDVRVDPGMPALVTGRAPLQQVFLNLIGNALRYAAGDPPRVRVGVRDAGDFHEFFVSDTGPGIPPRGQERIWTLFHTLEPEEKAEGTGIGLAVVKRLVEAHGGRVWVESQVGEGATFRFLWPRGDGSSHEERSGSE